MIGWGMGGRLECLQALAPLCAAGRIVYGGLRVVGVDDRGAGIVSRRNKFVFFTLVPPSTPPRQRAKVGWVGDVGDAGDAEIGYDASRGRAPIESLLLSSNDLELH